MERKGLLNTCPERRVSATRLAAVIPATIDEAAILMELYSTTFALARRSSSARICFACGSGNVPAVQAEAISSARSVLFVAVNAMD